MKRFGLVPLADDTGLHEVADEGAIVGNMKVCTEALHCLLNAFMSVPMSQL